MNLADEIVENAQLGSGPCENCPAHKATEGWCVNPGLSNPDGDIVFVTEEPSHYVDWNRFGSWEDYNKEYTQKFRGWRGGRFIQQHYLEPFGLTMGDAWVADSIKCRPEDKQGKTLFDKTASATHCQVYLEDELAAVDPKAIVTLGAAATERTLRALGVPAEQASQVKVSQDFGRCEFDTEWPVIITLHWAQRTVKQSTFLPVVKQALKDVLDDKHNSMIDTDRRGETATGNEQSVNPADPQEHAPQLVSDGASATQTGPVSESEQATSRPIGTNVFLVPFDAGNFGQTMPVKAPVDLSRYSDRPAPLADLEEARFWGARVGKRNQKVFEQMQPGDLLLFYHNKTYVRMGVVGRTFKDTDGWVSSTFWGGAPSRLIYTVEEYESIKVNRPAMNTIFGYKRDYYPQGLTRVADSKMNYSIPTIRRAVRGHTQRQG